MQYENWACVFNYRVRGPTYVEVLEVAENVEWIADLYGTRTKVVPIFPWLQDTRITRAVFLGMIPEVSKETREHVFAQHHQSYIASTIIYARTPSATKLREYIDSRVWYIPQIVEILGVSAPIKPDEIPREIFQ